MALLELATVDDVLRYPGLGTVSTADKLWIEKLIRGFASRAENYTGREFYTQSRAQDFSPVYHQRVLQLPAYGVSTNSITSIYEDTDRGFADASDLLSSDDYYFDWQTGLLTRDVNYFVRGDGVVRVTWTGGIGTIVDEVPDDLRTAAVMQTVFWWQRRNELGLQSRNFGGGSVNISAPARLLPEVEDVLASYRTVG